MTVTDLLTTKIRTALETMGDDAPRDLTRTVNHLLDLDGADAVTPADVLNRITDRDVNAPARTLFYVRLGRWMKADALDLPRTHDSTGPGSRERRESVFSALGLAGIDDDLLASTFADLDEQGHTLIVAENWKPWYRQDSDRDFYWRHYRKTLEDKGFGDQALAALDASTTDVVKRLANPEGTEAYQSKGLVMGYVQSGKTANFAGTVAKAVDAGYKLVIVLTGTIELLRSQTQKRLDKELVGVENVLGGLASRIESIKSEINQLPPEDRARAAELRAQLAEVTKDVDYVSTGDQDWIDGKFSSFGVTPQDAGAPRIIRLTTAAKDFQKPRFEQRLTDFKENLRVRSKPLYAPENLHSADALVAVVKKNSSTLQKLRTFLQSMSTDLADIPALIIDDEADQASINTKKQKSREQIERTKINEHIAGILESMPRCQYLAYTATPFANVFVDPDDAVDIFPKDFIVALDPSPEYMGAKQYFDLDGIPDDPTPATSNASAYYRPLDVDEDGNATDDGLNEALDAYVLAGAVKLWRREQLGDPGSLKHHTMMVHEAAKTSQHSSTHSRVLAAWSQAAHTSPAGVARLRALWENDFAAVSAARAAGSPTPTSFDELRRYVALAVQKINAGRVTDGKAHPAVLVNGTKESEYTQPDLDFDSGEVWKILVGGTKLSRGFTVEGLTVTVYTRVTVAADTLMQMARWFGYRQHYRDLVRLYLGNEIQKGNRVVSLYDAFASIAKDEEDFRNELRQFAHEDHNGEPLITPMDVAPLVTQRLPWLKPTGANKMYNAEIVEKAQGGRLVDMFAMPDRSTGANARNLERLSAILAGLTEDTMFLNDSGAPYAVRYGILSAGQVADFLDSFEFYDQDSYRAERSFVRAKSGIRGRGGIEDFVVYLPLLQTRANDHAEVEVPGLSGTKAHVLKRQRRGGNRHDFSGSSRRQRVAAEGIAGLPDDQLALPHEDLQVKRLRSDHRAAMMITLAADQKGGLSDPSKLSDPVKPDDIVTLLSIAVPYWSAPQGVIARKVRDPKNPTSAVVNAK